MMWSRAVGLGELALVLGADGADHGGAQRLAPLAEDEADAAGGRMHQDGVALLHLVGAAQRDIARSCP